MKPLERLKFFLLDLMSFFAVSIFVACIAFIGYGLATQCKNVAIYEYCGK